FRVAGWLAGVQDAAAALLACDLPASLGGPVGHGFAPDVVAAFAGELGLAAPVVGWHVRRTPVVGMAHALTVAGGAVGKIAADLLVMAQGEVGEAREGAPGGSSSMPHKANPTQSVLVVSAARQLPALASVLGASLVAEQERATGGWHAEWEPLRSMLRLAGGAAARGATYLPSVEYDEDALARNLAGLDVTADLTHVDAWIDRVLARQEEVFP
ncbi:MAG: 3-carboxy-cis,cis-muconate cycloisomerase, partial [Nocardioidaceae bacterium]|nr:3-carboxy-cis,cis-muconate cycloisomerase [Nocardioidaceae bacterium]